MSLKLIDLDNIQEFQCSGQIDINKLTIKAYHCTRAIAQDIESNGLKPFNLNERILYLRTHLINHGINQSHINQYETEVRKYISGMQLDGRNGKICFCLNRELFELDDGCDSFFKYFGGESMYRVAKNNENFRSIEDALQKMGEPLVVTAAISIKTADEYQKERIEQVINGSLDENCEVFIHEKVPPSDILQIEVINKDI